MSNKLTKDEFIEKCKHIHGNMYNYDNINYIGATFKIDITCFKHGVFSQTARKHLSGQKCPLCAIEKYTFTTDEFIKKSKLIHGENKYDYSLVDYSGSRNYVKIVCKEHGIFEQRPSNHLGGYGCSKCGGKYKSNKEEFILKANKIHNYLYNYDEVDYINNFTKVKIICKEHGIFMQTPRGHLSKNGCYKCLGIGLTNEDFIKKIKKLHNNLYIYDDINFKDTKSKINIKCKKHGYFTQKASAHLSGQGCPKCKLSKGELKIENILNENNIKYKPQFYFKDLKYKRYLRFDFGVLDDNNKLKYLLEFNGEQHYKYNGQYTKPEKEFKLGQLRDKLKIDYCIKNNIILEIIKWNENIQERMESILKRHTR